MNLLFSKIASNHCAFCCTLVAFLFSFAMPEKGFSQIATADFRTNAYAIDQSASYTNPAYWEYFNGTAWMPATQRPGPDNNVLVQTGHYVNLLDSVIIVNAGKTITVNGYIYLGTGRIKGGGAVTVTSGGTLNFGSKAAVSDAVIDNINVSGGLTISVGSTSIFSGLTAKVVAGRSFGNVTFLTKNISIAGDITVSNKMIVSNQSIVNANANVILSDVNSSLVVQNGGQFNIIDKQVMGGSGTQKVAVDSGGIFICGNIDGFSGGNGSAGQLTSINSSAETVTLTTGSTVKYNAHAGTQTITSRSNYSNVIMADTAIKALVGNSTFNRNLTVNAGSTLVCGTKTFSGSTTTATATIKGLLKVGSLNTAGAIAGNIPLANVTFITGSTVEFNGTSTQYSDGKLYSNIAINNASSLVMVSNMTVNGDLLINAGKKLDIADKILTLNGTLSGAGTLSGSLTAGLVANVPCTLTFTPGFNLLGDFTVNSTGTVSLASDLNIAGTLTPALGVLNLNNKLVTLKAGTTNQTTYPNTRVYPNTAVIGTVGASVSINYGASGAFVVERFIPNNRRYRFIAPGVTSPSTIRANWQESGSSLPNYGTHISGLGGAANGFDPTLTNNPSLFTFNNLTQVWSAAASTVQPGVLTAGSAWRLFVRGDRTIDLYKPTNDPTPTPTILRTTGQILTGNVTYNTTGNSNTPKLNPTNLAYSFIGNPYVSAVDWDDIVKYDTITGTTTGNVKDIRPEYTIIDPLLSLGDNGVFVTYNATSGTRSVRGSNMNRNIQPGQAFFVQTVSAAANPSPNPFITFAEANKVTGMTKVFKDPSQLTKLFVELFSTADTTAYSTDGIAVVFDNVFKSSLGDEDSYKIYNSRNNLSVLRHGISLCIEGRPAIAANDTVPLQISQLKQKMYNLQFAGVNFPDDITAFLKDNYLQQDIPFSLTDTAVIPFSLTTDSASFAPNRFLVVFKTGAVLPLQIINVKAYAKKDGIEVSWTAGTETNTARYEIEKSEDGQHFVKAGSTEAHGNNNLTENYTWTDGEAKTGENFYRIKAIGKSGSVLYSSVVKCNLLYGGGITIYPNPVKDKIVRLKTNNMPKGSYNAVIYNDLGQQIYAEIIEINGGLENHSISLMGKPFGTGTYRLRLTNETTDITKTVIAE